MHEGGVATVWWTLLALFACTPSATPPLPTSPSDEVDPTSGSDDDWVHADRVEGAVSEARCRPADQTLRLQCEATTEPGVELQWTLPGVLSSPTTEGPHHEVTLVGARAGDPWAWQAVGEGGRAEGKHPALPLPLGLAPLRVAVQGDAASVPAVLFRYGCGADDGVLILDGEGVPRWYDPGEAPATAVALGPELRVDLIVERSKITATTLGGERQLLLGPHPDPLHHDVHTDDEGQIWALFAEVVDNVVTDGLVVWSPRGEQLATWHLADHVVPGPGRTESNYWESAFPLLPDWSHGNSIVVRDGVGLVSLRWLDAVLAIDADVASPDFGRVLWALTGRDDGEVASDYERVGFDFVGQHHASFTADGRLMLFDNRLPPSPSRVLQMELDPDRGTAELVETWWMDTPCEVQGSAYELADGTVLATCGPQGAARAFRRGEPEAIWRLDVSCATLPHRLVPRFVPVEGLVDPASLTELTGG
jgi:hypothetical protein